MQKLEKWLIFSISLVTLCLGCFAVRHYIVHNILDEVYYNQQNSLGASALEKIEGVYNPVSRRPSGDSSTREWYDEEHLPDSVTSLGYTSGYSEGCFAFEVKHDVGNGSSRALDTSYKYDVESGMPYRELWVLDEATPNNNKEYVRTFPEEYGNSIDECIASGDNVVKNILLKGQCSVYNSRYFPDTWGDVTAKNRWERRTTFVRFYKD